MTQVVRVKRHVGSRDFIEETSFELDGDIALLVDPLYKLAIVVLVSLDRIVTNRLVIFWRRSVVGRRVFTLRVGIIKDVVFTFDVIQVGWVPVLLLFVVLHLNDSGSLLYYYKFKIWSVKI